MTAERTHADAALSRLLRVQRLRVTLELSGEEHTAAVLRDMETEAWIDYEDATKHETPRQ